jgi:hypothetical protein
MTCVFCPASMCPLIAKDGSPWTGTKNAPCPEHDDVGKGGCPWFSMACATGGIHEQVDGAAERGGRGAVIGPNRPRRPRPMIARVRKSVVGRNTKRGRFVHHAMHCHLASILVYVCFNDPADLSGRDTGRARR